MMRDVIPDSSPYANNRTEQSNEAAALSFIEMRNLNFCLAEIVLRKL